MNNRGFPSPLTILGIPSPKELFNEFVNLKERIEKLERKIEVQEKKFDKETKKIERLDTKIINLKKQLAIIKKNSKTSSTKIQKKITTSSLLRSNKLAQKLREKKKKQED